MANEFLRAEQIAATALGLLQREIVLPRLVTRLGIADFRGAKDDTVNLRVPASVQARTRVMRSGTALVADDLTETSVPIVLDTHLYQLANITDEQLTLDIRDFGEQVLQPQVRAVAEGMEDAIATSLAGATAIADPVTFDEGVDEPYDVAIDARKALNDLKVPMAGRVLLLGSAAEAAFLKSDKLSKVNESGSTDALRDATLTRVAGFTVVGSQALDPDAAYAFHASAIGFGAVAPVVPDGATFGQSQTYAGLAMRWLRDYDPTYARDRSLVDCFVGASSVEEDGTGGTGNYRLVKIDFTAESGS